jgi:hypothetical protein
MPEECVLHIEVNRFANQMPSELTLQPGNGPDEYANFQPE